MFVLCYVLLCFMYVFITRAGLPRNFAPSEIPSRDQGDPSHFGVLIGPTRLKWVYFFNAPLHVKKRLIWTRPTLVSRKHASVICHFPKISFPAPNGTSTASAENRVSLFQKFAPLALYCCLNPGSTANN